MIQTSIVPSRFTLILCEFHNPHIHGEDAQVEGHFIVHSCYNNQGFLLDTETKRKTNISLEQMKTEFLLELREKFETCQKHPFIRNYAKVVKKRYFTGPQIAEIICLPDENGHRVAILKTHWLRQIQRKWKHIYQERKRIISLRMRLSELRLYELTGKGSKECSYLPGIAGMLT